MRKETLGKCSAASPEAEVRYVAVHVSRRGCCAPVWCVAHE